MLNFSRAACLAAALAALAGCGGAKPPDPVEDLLSSLRRKARSVRSLEASFEEEKTLAELARPVRISGTLWLEGRRDGVWMRLEAENPEPSTVLVTPREIRMYSPRERTLDRADWDKAPAWALFAQAFFLLYAVEKEELERAFEISVSRENPAPGRSLVTLVPRSQEQRSLVRRMEVEVEEKTGLLAGVRFSAAGGDRYVWAFRNHKTGVKHDPERFELKVPEGTVTLELGEERQ